MEKNLEILMQIQSDVSAIRAHGEDMRRRQNCAEADIQKHDTRLRRLEVILLPISAVIGWIFMR